MNKRALLCCLLLMCLIGSHSAAHAEVSSKDIQVVASALGFIDGAPSGSVNLGIVYSEANAQSTNEANALKAMLGAGLTVGNLTLKPVLVKIGDVAGAGNIAAFFLTDGVGAEASQLTATLKSKRKACVTTDFTQVQSAVCAMGIKSEPKVEIVVNKAAAADAGISFSAAFRMMIT
ncbi:MAG: hypothetical protein WAW96_03585, partial [Alphaproteobacteria bacterium]